MAERALRAAGFELIRDIAEADVNKLAAVVGARAAELIELARGHDERPVIANQPAKSYGEENTFERDISDSETVTAALTSHAHAVAQRLRHDEIERAHHHDQDQAGARSRSAQLAPRCDRERAQLSAADPRQDVARRSR